MKLQSALIAIICALLLSCSSAPTPTAAAAAPARPAPEPQAPQPSFIASGPIVVENQVDVMAQRSGVLSQIMVETGASVRKGQLLARIDDRQLTAERDAAEAKARSIDADVKNWEAESKVEANDYDRAEQMFKASLITKEQVDHAKYKSVASQFEVEREKENLRNAQNTAKALNLELEKTRIVAPFDGVVARRYVRAGQKVSENDRLFWITATSPMRVKFTLPEMYLGKVKKGSEVTVVAPAAGDQSYPAKVVLVSPVVDPSSGTIELTAELTGKPGDLRPGMTANIRLPNSR